MARRKASEIKVNITGDADLSAARREIDGEWRKIERGAKDTAKKIEAAFDDIEISPELDTGALRDAESSYTRFVQDLESRGVDLEVDTDQLRRAFDLAQDLDRLTVGLDVEADVSQLEAAEALARNLRSFTGRIDLDVQGTADLRDALGISEALDRTRAVKIEVQGRQDLERAEAIVRDLDGSNIDVRVDANTGDLGSLNDQFAEAGDSAAGAFETGFDVQDVGGSLSTNLVSIVSNLGPWGVAAAGIGAFLADDLAEGFNNSWGGARQSVILSVRNSLSGAEMEAVGEAAATAYGEGFGESLASVRDTAAIIKAELGDIDESLDLTEATRQAETLAEVFGVDVIDSVTAVDKLVQQGLVRNTEEGFELLFELGQQTGLQFEEMLELTNEFSTAIKALGIDGPQGLKLIGEMVERGIFPQVDQAGEVFEELNETIISGGAAEALEDIGLNAEEMQRRIAAGGPDAALAVTEIADQLLATNDNALQASATAEIFGGNMGLLGDEARETALQLFSTADATSAVGDGLSKATDDLAATRTNIDKLKQAFQDLGSAAADGFDAFIGGGQNAGVLAGFDSLAERIAGVESATEKLSGAANTLSGGLVGVQDVADKTGTTLVRTSDDFAEVEGGAIDAAGGVDSAAEAVERLDAALSDFAGRFDADATFRNIIEDSEAAAEAVAGLTSASFDLGTGFDVSTEAGRKAESAVEDLSGNLDDLIELYQDGAIEAPQFAAGQAEIEAAVRGVAAQMGLTQAETDELVERYATVPTDITTDIGINDNATGPVNGITETIGNVPTSKSVDIIVNNKTALAAISGVALGLAGLNNKTVTVTTVTKSIRALERAKGGDSPAGVPTLVGEEGPELRVFKQPGYIYTAEETRRLLAGAKIDPNTPTMVGAGVGRGGVHIENWTVERGRDPWQDILLLEQIYSL